VRTEQLGSHGTNFDEIGCMSFLRKSFEEIQISLKSDKNNGTLREDVSTFMPISRLIVLRMRNILDKTYRENTKHTFYVQ
jgi:hypothetical protein